MSIDILYLSGPVTGYGDPQANLGAFNVAAQTLIRRGYTVLNPADNVLPNKDVDERTKWQQYMRLGFAQLIRAEGVVLLPHWEHSRGATLEVYVATQLGMALMSVSEWCKARPMSRTFNEGREHGE